jgi:hypothetical protein
MFVSRHFIMLFSPVVQQQTKQAAAARRVRSCQLPNRPTDTPDMLQPESAAHSLTTCTALQRAGEQKAATKHSTAALLLLRTTGKPLTLAEQALTTRRQAEYVLHNSRQRPVKGHK